MADQVETSRNSDCYSHANRIFVRAILESPQPTLSILDVGCWNGTLGRVLLGQRSMIVDGIERDPAQAASARSAGYRRVDCVDLNHEDIPMIDRRYDFVLFGDVLEHLLDPARILSKSVDLLNPGGKVLVSLPNIAFITCRLSHLLGHWDYKDYGIMDRTHLRFFTRRTMLQLLQQCGYRAQWIEGYVGLAGYPAYIRAPLRWLGRVWPAMFAIQIVICAHQQAAQ